MRLLHWIRIKAERYSLRFFDRDQQAITFLISFIIIMAYFVNPLAGLLYFPWDKTDAKKGEQVREVFIQVEGLVRRPGVYSFHKNPRYEEAIQKSGGLSEDLVLESCNWMPVLSNGDRLTIIKKDSGEAGITITAMDAAKQLVLGIPLDINTADSERLDVLPGVGSGLADRIVRFREEYGPVKTLEDLLKVHGMGRKKLEQLAPYISIKKF
jgi:competence protein ComEA